MPITFQSHKTLRPTACASVKVLSGKGFKLRWYKRLLLRDPTRKGETRLLETSNSRKQLPLLCWRLRGGNGSIRGAAFRSCKLENTATAISSTPSQKGSKEKHSGPLSYSILWKVSSASHLTTPTRNQIKGSWGGWSPRWKAGRRRVKNGLRMMSVWKKWRINSTLRLKTMGKTLLQLSIFFGVYFFLHCLFFFLFFFLF